MEYEEFRSDLGNVAVSKEHIEREHRESDEWEKITETFSEEELLEKAYYRDIEDVELDEGEMFPNIRVKTEGKWKRLFFRDGDKVQECFKLLEYRIKAFRQNHQ